MYNDEFPRLNSRKEKVSCCAIIVEGICSPTVRQNTKFPQILSAAIETLLALCNDKESDVRMVADESLNRIIRVPHLALSHFVPIINRSL